MLAHPFKANKALQVTNEAKEVVASIKKNALFDNAESGSRLDAFRHAFWMARMTQEIGPHRAFRLGKAHEKGNYRQFKKGRKEDGWLPDEPSGKMDYLNNDAGIETGKRNPEATPEQLSEIILQMIAEGKLYIISRDSSGNFLDCSGKVIDMEMYRGKWLNPKCVIPTASRKH